MGVCSRGFVDWGDVRDKVYEHKGYEVDLVVAQKDVMEKRISDPRGL